MRKRTVKLLTGLAIVLVALGVIYAIWVGISAAKLRRAYAALEADGRPMRTTDVIPLQVDTTENAALLYESASRLLEAQPAPETNLLEYLGDLSDTLAKDSLEPDKRSELQSLLQEEAVTHALFAIRQAVERPTCRFDLDYDAGMNMLMPHLKGLRDLARILGAKARFEAEAGRSDRAWNLALTQLKLADALRTEPTLVSQMVRVACIRISCRTIQRLCAVAPPNQQQYGNLQNALKELDDVAPLVRATDGERLVFGETIFTLPRGERRRALAMLAVGESAPGILRLLFDWRVSFKPVFLADHATYLHTMRKHAQTFEHPYSTNEMEALGTIVEKQITHMDLLTRILVPAIRRVKEVHTEMTAEIRITRLGLMLLRYKDAQNAFPTTLTDLSPEGLDDPFTGDPLRYELETDGFTLYSLATDQEDNHGRPQVPKDNAHYDIVWRFPSETTR